MSFRARATLTIAGLTALALGGAFVAVTVAFNGLQRRQLDASLHAVAREEAAEAASHGFSFSEGPGPAGNDVGPLTKYGVIYGEHGNVLSGTPPFDTAPPALLDIKHPLGEAFDLRFKREHLRGILVGIPGHPAKRVFLATSRDDLDGDEAFLLRAMLGAWFVAVMWAAAVAYWMGGRLTRDHQAIATVARSVARGDLSARAEVRSGDPEVSQLGRDINDMVEQLAELLGSHERFIAHAAHELRSPITAIYGELQQALRKERTAEGYRTAIETALATTRRLKLLADDLLKVARTKAERGSNAFPIRLESALEDAMSDVAELARGSAVKFSGTWSVAWCIPDSNGDTRRLFRNLLENAVQNSPPGGTVSATVELEREAVRVVVSDEGEGVDASEREAIFEPFFRGRTVRKREGSGLGLGIAREIARAHGGDVTIAPSAPGERGARFLVHLPLLPLGDEGRSPHAGRLCAT
ncbi:MAG TPA: HAMP domain-containing sensor histidine kinase [Polyangiaceae bacterium]